MNANPKTQPITRASSRSASAEQRLKELRIELPAPPEPFGTYAEAVQTGNLLFLTGMLPTEGRAAKFFGARRRGTRCRSRSPGGSSRGAQRPRCRARASGLARQSNAGRPAWRLGSHFRRRSRSAESRGRASDLLQDVFGKEKNPCRLVYGVASLPLGTPVELEVIFEVEA